MADRHNLVRITRSIQQRCCSKLRPTSRRSLLIIILLLLTTDRLPAPVSEFPETPKLKRTFFTLEGNAVDTFINEKKLPPAELDSAFSGAIHVLATPPLNELAELMKKFGHRLARQPDFLTAGFNGQDLTPEMQRREAAIQRIAKSQLKKIAAAPLLPMTRGAVASFLAGEVPSEFFNNHAWHLENTRLHEVLISGVKRSSPSRIEIPISSLGGSLVRYATRADMELLRRVNNSLFNDGSGMGFYTDISRASMPERLLRINVEYDECGSSTAVTVQAPPVQVRLLVLENVTNAPIVLGQFHFRLVNPGRGVLAVRTRSENDRVVALTRADSQSWYKPRVLKPGEKVIVPLELLLKPDRWNLPEGLTATAQAARRAYANQLLTDRELQTVAIMYEGKQRVEAGMTLEQAKSTPLVVMPKRKFVETLSSESNRPWESDEFVYGPAIDLEAVDVDGPTYAIEPLDPTNIAYFSGYAEGSCPFAYCRRAGGPWAKQGAILIGRSSKLREGTTVLDSHDFDGTVRITEEEDETSYIDQLFVRGTLARGETVTVLPPEDVLRRIDHRYLVLTKGKTAEVKFTIPDGMRRDHVQIVASGYFVTTSSKQSR